MMEFEEVKGLDSAYAASRRGPEPMELVAALWERYPFLVPRNYLTDEILDAKDERVCESRFSLDDGWKLAKSHSVDGWTQLCGLDWGWRRAFGIEICEDVRTVLLAIGGQEALARYRLLYVKEKFGGMRWETAFSGDGYPEAKQSAAAEDPRSMPLRWCGAWRWLRYVEQFYSSVSGRFCIVCGGVEDVKKTAGLIVPVCPCSGRWSEPDAAPLPRPAKDAPFFKRLAGGNTDFKGLVVGRHAPVVDALGLPAPLHATEVWERLAMS